MKASVSATTLTSKPESAETRLDRPWLAALDRILGHCIEWPIALIVLTEICILFAGVVARYLLHAPIVWVDELASILFLWLTVLGSVVALRRGQHMRMTALVSRASPGVRAYLDVLAMACAMSFLLLVIMPAVLFAQHEVAILSPALQIANAWRAAALPVGIALMILSSALQLLRHGRLELIVSAFATVCVISLLLLAAQPWLIEIGKFNLLVFFVLIVGGAVLAGVPIAFAFGLATFGYLSITTSVPVTVVVGRMDEGMSHLILLAVPLFVFLGLLIEMTGMARAMVGLLVNAIGHRRGGLSYAMIGAMYLVSGISGAKAADIAAIAPVLLPEMKRRGSDPGEMLALLAATAAQTETVPPSIVLIAIGSVTGISIAALFTGGLLPAFVLAVALCILVWIRHRRVNLSALPRPTRQQLLRGLWIALPALTLPFIIRFAVVEGVATATEVTTIGVFYAALLGLCVYRQFDWRRLMPMLVDTAALSGAILLIIGTATAMAWCLTRSGFSADLAALMTNLPGGQIGFLLVSIILFILLGSLLEGVPAIVLFGPLLFPIAHQLGVHEVHYAMVVILSMGIGLFAPPFGVGYYMAAAISQIDPDVGIRPIVAYLLTLFFGVVLIALVPWISIGFL